MPTYDYVCSACGHRFEEFQSMTAPVLRKCPACKKQKLDRLIGAGAGVIFKGSGFYQTDYKNAGSRDAGGKADAGKQSDSKQSDSKQSDSKQSDSGEKGGGCSPACGTDKAPAGCKMPKKD